jgi:uncharacterized membrane protein YqjE
MRRFNLGAFLAGCGLAFVVFLVASAITFTFVVVAFLANTNPLATVAVGWGFILMVGGIAGVWDSE